MTDYSELVKALRCKRDDCEGCDLAFLDNDEGWMCQYAAKDDDAAAAIEDLQAQLPKRGEWRLVTPDSYIFNGYRCSLCNELVYGMTNYCPNCGAKMMEVQE